MLMAAIAFPFHVGMMISAQAANVTGFKFEPAVSVSGPVHQHGVLGAIHLHSGNNAAGHVHDPDADRDDQNSDPIQFWSLGCSAAVMPTLNSVKMMVSVEAVLSTLEASRLEGIDPAAMHRPPSTPDIA